MSALLLNLSGVFFFTIQVDITSKRESIKDKVGVPKAKKFGDAGGETDTKFADLNFENTGEEKMPELVGDDEETNDQKKNDDGV
jgi:hypothetical protein